MSEKKGNPKATHQNEHPDNSTPQFRGGNAGIAQRNYDVPNHCIGLYNPIPQGSETDIIRARIADLTRTQTTLHKLATQAYADSSASYQRALRWDTLANETCHLLSLAFRRLWAIEGARHAA